MDQWKGEAEEWRPKSSIRVFNVSLCDILRVVLLLLILRLLLLLQQLINTITTFGRRNIIIGVYVGWRDGDGER